jgi:hypothetical protein
MNTDREATTDSPEAISSARRRLLSAMRPGTRLQRVHSSHSYGFVLALVVASFVFLALAPDERWAVGVIVLMEASILSAAIWTSGFGFGRYVIPIVITTGMLVTLWIALDASSTPRIAGGVADAVFLVTTCAVIGFGVLDQQTVNKQSVLGALSIYVTVGILFTAIYGAIADVDDATFFAQDTDGSPADRLYFSFVTLATLGYGDYTARGELGRLLAVVEALIGQLYLVTVVALLVANIGHSRQPPAA